MNHICKHCSARVTSEKHYFSQECHAVRKRLADMKTLALLTERILVTPRSRKG